MLKHKNHTDPQEGSTLPGIPDLMTLAADAAAASAQEQAARELIEFHRCPELMTVEELTNIDDL